MTKLVLPPRTWIRKNLFRTPGDSVMTVVLGGLGLWAILRALRFVFVTGRWTIVRKNLSLYLTGSWPTDQLWRLIVAAVAVTTATGLIAGHISCLRQRTGLYPAPLRGVNRARELAARLWPLLALGFTLLLLARTPGPWMATAAAALAGVIGHQVGSRLPPRATLPLVGLMVVGSVALVWFVASGLGWDQWGGMVLNVFLATVSIVLCFPLGVLLALGRRSELPIVRALSTGYIELFRGLPLIALLLMANVALGFFIPQDLAPGKVVRAIVIFTMFTAAYVAEIVRGGLQSVPRGQLEAGRAVGLSPVRITFLIVLPQALRNVIPSLVGQFISLFKDTTLAGAAMGFTDLLSAASSSTKQPEFNGQGLFAESALFVLLMFWVGSYTMSRESQRIESRLGVGER